MSEVSALINRLSIFCGDQAGEAASALEEKLRGEEPCEILKGDVSFTVKLILSGVGDVSIRPLCMLIANGCTTADLQQVALDCGIEDAIHSVLSNSDLSNASIFAALDVIASFCSQSGEARIKFGCLIPEVIQCARSRGAAEIVFGAAVCLATLTIANDSNVMEVIHRGGATFMLTAYRQAALNQTNHNRKQIFRDIQKWSKEVLMNCSVLMPQDHLNELDFGKFGENLSVDELKTDILLRRRRLRR
jgi:hypothetical protein